MQSTADFHGPRASRPEIAGMDLDPVTGSTSPRPALVHLVEACVADEVITAEQGAELVARAAEQGLIRDRGPARGAGVATEALGYVGGVVVVVSAILIANLYWGELSATVRVAVLGATALMLLAGGLAVPERSGGVGIRLRSALWLAATAASSGFLGVLGSEALELADSDTAVLTAVGTTSVAAVLWWRHRHLVQQVAAWIAAMATAATVTADRVTSDLAPGFAAWLVAAAWFATAWSGRLSPRPAAVPLSAAAAIVAAMTTTTTDWGVRLGLVTVTVPLALAVRAADLALLTVGAVGTFVVLPAAATAWFPDSAAAPFGLLCVGLLLVGIALWTARRRSARHRAAETGAPGERPDGRGHAKPGL